MSSQQDLSQKPAKVDTKQLKEDPKELPKELKGTPKDCVKETEHPNSQVSNSSGIYRQNQPFFLYFFSL